MRLVVQIVERLVDDDFRPSVPVAKRGVVTLSMAVVGDPGNPSVGVWQVFKTVGASGAGVTLPPTTARASTGVALTRRHQRQAA